MRKRKFADVVLVFDSYYHDKPNALVLILKRILLCCGINLCALMYIIQLYQLSVNKFLIGTICILASILFSSLFVFVKKIIAIPSIFLIAGLVIWRIGTPFFEHLSLFWDKILLVMDGKFFHATFFLSNSVTQIDPRFLAYQSSELLGVILLVSVFSLITAACLFNKIHSSPMILAWIILWIPVLVGEKLYFNWWLIPSLALYVAVIAMSISYSQGLAIGNGGTSYHNVVRYNEISFLRRTKKQPYTSKVVNRHEYYSKYYSLVTYLFTVFIVLGIISSLLLSGRDGLDYSNVYNFLNSIGPTIQRTSPFESGALSEYFTNSKYNVNFRDATLGITSPGQSNQEILSVTNSGDLPVYLRGDIGIDFVGGSWTSPIRTGFDSGLWTQTGLSNDFRPAEMNALSAYIDYYERNYDFQINGFDSNMIHQQDVTVNYLCDTNVAFLPAYATDFGYYENEMFDIYGDFVARANQKYDTVSTLNFTALVPSYTNVDRVSSMSGSSTIERTSDTINSFSCEIDEYFDDFCGSDNLASYYRDFVNNSYLNIPSELVEPLSEFISANNLNPNGDISDISVRYQTAANIADFLRENYVYSLIALIDPNNPIMSFLNDVKSGHCALYASSMTLLLRELGIPARYCTGFVAQPGGGEPQILRTRNLHAWCEVYLDQLGWLTFDPTSAAAMGNIDIDISFPNSPGEFSIPPISIDISSNSVQSNEISNKSSEGFSDSDDESNNTDDSMIASFDGKVNALPYILGISGIVIVVGATAFAIYWYKTLETDAKNAMKRLSKINDSDLLLEKIHGVMRVCGFYPNRGELPEDFYMRADKSLGCAIYSNHEVLEAAAFGKSGRSDCRVLAKLLENLYNQAEKDLKFTGRIRLRKNLVKNK